MKRLCHLRAELGDRAPAREGAGQLPAWPPLFYEGADRAEIIWEDAEVDLFCQLAPELHADAVRLARETGLRIGDLVELERSEIRGRRMAAVRLSWVRTNASGAS